MESVPETEQVLRELARYGDTGLAAELRRMGRVARDLVPECVGLSLGLLQDGLTLTLVATDAEIAALDAVQYLDGGPCVAAAHEDRAIEALPADMVSEGEWQMYARASAAAGVRSSLTLPLERDGQVVGSINLYASTEDAFDGRREALAEALGASALHAVSNADLSFSTRLEAARGMEKLTAHSDVDTALGIIAASQDVTIDEARDRLRQAAARAGITEEQAARAIRELMI
jgi:GAF domain-containing protein